MTIALSNYGHVLYPYPDITFGKSQQVGTLAPLVICTSGELTLPCLSTRWQCNQEDFQFQWVQLCPLGKIRLVFQRQHCRNVFHVSKGDTRTLDGFRCESGAGGWWSSRNCSEAGNEGRTDSDTNAQARRFRRSPWYERETFASYIQTLTAGGRAQLAPNEWRMMLYPPRLRRLVACTPLSSCCHDSPSS